MASRLPSPGGDDGSWGQILNDFLSQAHNPDGSLKQLNQSQIQNLTNDLAAKASTVNLAPVATSGSYTDLIDKPTIPDISTLVDGSQLDAKTTTLINDSASQMNVALKKIYQRGVSIASAGATTGAANNAAIIQALIDAAFAAGGGTIFIPAGAWKTGPLILKTGVRLVGEGERASRLRLIDGADTHFITLADGNTEQTGIESLYLDGNGANQTTGDVVHLDNTGYDNGRALPSIGDPSHYMRRVTIVNAKGHGIYTAGSYSGSLFEGLVIKDCDRNGFRISSPDNHLVSVTVERSGLEGFFIEGNSNRLLGCKVFLSGRLSADNTQGTGFTVSGVSRIDLVECEAQDNREHGYGLNSSTQLNMVGCRADRNGLGQTSTGYAGDGLFARNITVSRIELVSGDRNEGGTRMQRWTYNCGTGNSGNIVTILAGRVPMLPKQGLEVLVSNSVGWVLWNGAAAAGWNA